MTHDDHTTDRSGWVSLNDEADLFVPDMGQRARDSTRARYAGEDSDIVDADIVDDPEPTTVDDDGPDILSAALTYARMGWPIFPTSGKRPALHLAPNWSTDSTTDPEQIVAWYAGTSGLGIGVDMGRSGLAAIDVDHPEYLPSEIHAVLESARGLAWLHQGNPERCTWVYETAGRDMPQAVGKDDQGRTWGEVKAEGGYIVLAPSPHPDGWTYRWLAQPGDRPGRIPADLIPLVAPRASEAGPRGPWTGEEATQAHVDAAVALRTALVASLRSMEPETGRNAEANRVALILGHYVGHVLDEDVTVAMILEACKRNGLVKDTSPAAVLASIHSGLRKGQEDPQLPNLTRQHPPLFGEWQAFPGGHASGTEEDDPDAEPDLDEDTPEGALLAQESAEVRRLALDMLARERARVVVHSVKALRNPSGAYVAGYAEDLPQSLEEWRVDGLMPRDSRLLVVAQRKTGKTTLALNLARSLGTGEEFLEEFTVARMEAGERVALLNYEVSPHTIRGWADAIGVPRGLLYVVNLRGRRNPLEHPEDRDALAAELRAEGVRVLMVDPFGRAYSGDQNTAGEVTQWLMDLDRFTTDVGATELILTVHAGWSEAGRARGSSALEDWPDTIMRLTRDDDLENQDGVPRFMSAEGRDVDVEERGLVMDPITHRLTLDGGGRKAKAKALALGKVQAEILAWLDIPGNDGATADALEKGVGGNRTRLKQARDALVSQGLLKVEDGAHGAKRFHLVPR